MYGDVPPEAEAVADPSLDPLQETFDADIEAKTAVGSVTVTVAVSVQLLSSSAVTVYVPAANPVTIPPDDPFDQE